MHSECRLWFNQPEAPAGACAPQAVVQFAVVWHLAMYETLTSSSYGTGFKCLQLHGTTVLLSQSDDEDDEWEGEEGKW